MIVSSDSDFTRLATRLRESGKTVYGMGAKKTPRAFRDACDKFTFLEVLRAEAEPQAQAPAAAVAEAATAEPAREASPGDLQSLLTKALNKTATTTTTGRHSGALGSHLNRIDPSFDPRTYGFAKLSDLVKEQPFLETKTVSAPSGQGQLWVRLKRRAAAQKSAKKPARKSAAKTAEPVEPAEPVEEPVVEPAKKAPARRRTTRKVGQASGGGGSPGPRRGCRRRRGGAGLGVR